MTELFNITRVEDDSVQKKIEKTAKNLKNKYSKRRNINEKVLKEKSSLQKFFSVFFNCLCVVLVGFSAILCFSNINNRIQNSCPTFAGFSNLQILSSSMVDSGFNVGDTVVVRTVDTDTLHVNDKIAFYAYSGDYNQFDINSCVRVENDTTANVSFTTSFASIFGIQKKSLRNASKAGAPLIFHHIRAIFQDENGTRWFKTYGSSNSADDAWYISENMIVGCYDDSATARVFSAIISAISSNFGVLFLIVPILLLGFSIVFECVKDVNLVRLELDCVEEKRKITDPICVKNNVGFNMDNKTKYKILAQASAEDKNVYINLLWKNAPNSIRKYYIHKNLLLKYDEKLLKTNRECENMLKNGVKDEEIAKYYLKEKERITKEQKQMQNRLKIISKNIK